MEEARQHSAVAIDYIPILEVVLFTAPGTILIGTWRGLREGEVHFPAQFLFESGYQREHSKFRLVVAANFTIAAILIALAILNATLVYSGRR